MLTLCANTDDRERASSASEYTARQSISHHLQRAPEVLKRCAFIGWRRLGHLHRGGLRQRINHSRGKEKQRGYSTAAVPSHASRAPGEGPRSRRDRTPRDPSWGDALALARAAGTGRWAEGRAKLSRPRRLLHRRTARTGREATGNTFAADQGCRSQNKPAGLSRRGGISGDDVTGRCSYEYVGILEGAKAAGWWGVSPALLSTDPVTQGFHLRYLQCASAWAQTAAPILGRGHTTVLSSHSGAASFSKELRLSG